MIAQRFHDRCEAGRLLAAKLAAYADRPDVVVLALPRGGPLRMKWPVRFTCRSTCLSFANSVSPATKSWRWVGAVATGGRSVRRGAAFRRDPRGQAARITAEWEAGELPETSPFAV
jgi:predicted phosphoribosyltransferase